MNSKYFNKQINLRAPENLQPNISAEEVEKILVWMPEDDEEKTKIVETLSNLELLINLKIKYLNEIKKIKKAMLHQLLTGQKRVKI